MDWIPFQLVVIVAALLLQRSGGISQDNRIIPMDFGDETKGLTSRGLFRKLRPGNYRRNKPATSEIQGSIITMADTGGRRITAPNCDQLTISGTWKRATASGSLSQVSISGQSNQLIANQKGTSASFHISGSHNVVQSKGSIISQLHLSGSHNRVLSGSGRVTTVIISGNGNVIKTGRCEQLSISGISNTVTISGNCNSVIVGGSKNVIFIQGKVDSLTIGDLRNKDNTVCDNNNAGPHQNTLNLKGIIGTVEIIQGCVANEGLNTISSASTTNRLTISGSKNKFISKKRIGYIDFNGRGNVVSCPMYGTLISNFVEVLRGRPQIPQLGQYEKNVVVMSL